MGKLEDLSPLERLALRVAIETLKRESKHSWRAYVPWDTVREIRVELEKQGFSWRAGVRKRVELEKEARRKRRQEYQARSDACNQSKEG